MGPTIGDVLKSVKEPAGERGMAGRVDGKVAIVTGAASGMGRIMARALLDDGAKVAAVDRNVDGLADFTREATSMGAGDRFTTFAVDVRYVAPVEQVVARTIAHFGGLHALINNAGLGMHQVLHATNRKIKFWEAPPDKWQQLMDVNVRGAFLTSRAVVPHFLKQGWGRIVNVTTSFDTMLEEGFSPYGPSKAALEAQSAIWAKDLAGTGVSLNILIPGGAADTPRPRPRPRPGAAGGDGGAHRVAGLRRIRRRQRLPLRRTAVERESAADRGRCAKQGADRLARLRHAIVDARKALRS
jgi:3-oxoacyl-[acyl-carrier protein] reductase